MADEPWTDAQIPGLDILRRDQPPDTEAQASPPFAPQDVGELPGMGILRRPPQPGGRPLPPPDEPLEEAPWWADPTGFVSLPAKIAAPIAAVTVGPAVAAVARAARPVTRRVGPVVSQAASAVMEHPLTQAVAQGVKDHIGQPLKEFRSWLAPGTASEEAAQTTRILRHRGAEAALSGLQADAALTTMSKEMAKLTPEERLTFIDWMEHGMPEPFAGFPATPGLQGVAIALREVMDDRVVQVQQLGTGALAHARRDYFPHLWKDPDPEVLAQLEARLSGRAGFTEPRSLDYVREGMALGLKPVTTNPVDLVLMHIGQMDKYLMGQRVLKEMQESGLAKTIAPDDPIPPGWTRLPDAVTRTETYAPKEVTRVLETYLAPGLGQVGAYQMARNVNNTLTAAQLGLSAFHATAEAMNTMMSRVALGTQQLGRGEIGRGLGNVALGSMPWEPIRAAVRGSRLLEAAKAPGAAGTAYDTIVERLTQGGMRFATDPFYRNSAAGNFWEALKQSPVSEPLRRLAAPLMEELVPRLKAGVAFDLAEDVLRRLPPNATQDDIRQAMARVVDSVDNRLGLLAYDNLFWHRTLKDLGMLSTRALGWNIGTVRELGGGAVDWGKALTGALSGQAPEVTERMGYTMALPFVTALYGSMAHYLRTGERPKDIKDRFYPGPEGERWSLPTYLNDVVSWQHDPAGTVWHKASPLLHSTVEMLTNTDFYGDKIVQPEPGDTGAEALVRGVGQAMNYVAQQYVPFTARSMWSDLEQGDVPQAVASFFGLKRAPRRMQRTEEEEEALRAWEEKKKQMRRER